MRLKLPNKRNEFFGFGFIFGKFGIAATQIIIEHGNVEEGEKGRDHDGYYDADDMPRNDGISDDPQDIAKIIDVHGVGEQAFGI